MRRRLFIRLAAGMAAASALAGRPRAAEKMRRLGVLMIGPEDEPDSKLRIAAFRQGLQDLGWRNGENIQIEYRWSAGRSDLIRRYAEELIRLAPDIIVANGTPVVAALKPLSRSIPMVFVNVFDPVGFGFVDSLSRPGGNLTGFTFIDPPLIGKWTALLKDAAPGVSKATLLYNAKINPYYPKLLREVAAAAQSLAIPVAAASIGSSADLQPTIEAMARIPGSGLMIGPDGFMIAHIREAAQLAAANRLPGISVYRQFALEGGLMAYGPDVPDIFRRSAEYVDRILKGAHPGELPVQEPTKFEFTINRKAAQALGLTLSPMLLSFADEVIE